MNNLFQQERRATALGNSCAGMRNLLCGAIILLSANGIVQADSIYSNQAAWAAAVTGATTINFEGIAPNNGNVYIGSGPGASTTVGGVNFAIGPTSTVGMLFVTGDGSYPYPPVSTVSSQTTDIKVPNDLLITLPSAVTALGFHFGDFTGQQATITLSDGTVRTVTAAAGGYLAFFGVTAPGGITSVDITEPGTSYFIGVSDFSYGTALPTPIPGAIWMVGSALVGLIGLGRRKLPAYAS